MTTFSAGRPGQGMNPLMQPLQVRDAGDATDAQTRLAALEGQVQVAQPGSVGETTVPMGTQAQQTQVRMPQQTVAPMTTEMKFGLPAGAVMLSPEVAQVPFAPARQSYLEPAFLPEQQQAPASVPTWPGGFTAQAAGWQVLPPWYGAVPGVPVSSLAFISESAPSATSTQTTQDHFLPGLPPTDGLDFGARTSAMVQSIGGEQALSISRVLGGLSEVFAGLSSFTKVLASFQAGGCGSYRFSIIFGREFDPVRKLGYNVILVFYERCMFIYFRHSRPVSWVSWPPLRAPYDTHRTSGNVTVTVFNVNMQGTHVTGTVPARRHFGHAKGFVIDGCGKDRLKIYQLVRGHTWYTRNGAKLDPPGDINPNNVGGDVDWNSDKGRDDTSSTVNAVDESHGFLGPSAEYPTGTPPPGPGTMVFIDTPGVEYFANQNPNPAIAPHLRPGDLEHTRREFLTVILCDGEEWGSWYWLYEWTRVITADGKLGDPAIAPDPPTPVVAVPAGGPYPGSTQRQQDLLTIIRAKK